MSEGVLQFRVWKLEKALKATFESEHEYVGKQIADTAFAKFEADQLRTQLAASEEKLRVAREAFRRHLDTMGAINAHSGYTFSQPLIEARAALKAIGEGE